MRNSPLLLIALAAVSALSATVALTQYSAAQSQPSELRLVRPEVKLIKPSRPTRENRVEPRRPEPPAGALQLKAKQPTVGTVPNLSADPQGGGDPWQLADLVVIPFYDNDVGLPEGFPEHSYCVKKPTGGTPNQIKFWIRNGGPTATGSFQWHSSYPKAGAAPGGVIANIPAGGQTLITQNMPDGCYSPGGFSASCPFTIHLDDHDEVEEQSEANTFSSYCVSPAG